MEKPVAQLHQILHKLTGLHRQLLDLVRQERETLVQANIQEIEGITFQKQALIEGIHQAESSRLKLLGELALLWRRPIRDLTLPQIIIEVQGRDPSAAEQLRTQYNALTHLIQRISEQNSDNRALIEKSLEHIHQMKRNVLGEASQKSSVYTPNAQKTVQAQGARLLSREA